MSNKTDKLLQRVAFRLPNEKYEKIKSVLDDGKYNSQSNFLRSAVDLLLFWEKKIKKNDVTDSKLRESIGVRVTEFVTDRDKIQEISGELLKKYEELQKEENDLKKVRDYLKPAMNNYGKMMERDSMKIVVFFIQLIRNLYSQFEDTETTLNIKEWETQTIADSSKILDKIIAATKDKKKTSKSIPKISTVTKGVTAKEFFKTVDASQFKKEGKKKN